MTTYLAENKQSGFLSLARLPLMWLLVAMLFGYASDGILWFRTSAAVGLNATYGNLAAGQSGTVDTAFMLLALTISIASVAIFGLHRILQAALRNPALIVLPVWVFASAVWSQYPLITLEWAPCVFIAIVFVLYLSTSLSSQTQMRLVLLLGSVCLLLTIIVSTVFHYRDPEGGWRGIYPQKNMCCMNTEFMLTPALYASGLSSGNFFRLFRIAYILVSIAVIVLTKSSTGLVVLPLLLGVAVFLKTVRVFRVRDRAILIFGFSILAVCTAVIGISSFSEIVQTLGKDPTLTGRTEIWRALAVSIAKRPMMGYGYRAFFRGYEGESASVSLAAHWAVPGAHNAALDVTVTLGLIGLMIVAWFCLKATRDAFTCLVYTDSRYSRWYATIIILMFLNSIDEAEILMPFCLNWLLFMLAAVSLSTMARRGSRARDHVLQD